MYRRTVLLLFAVYVLVALPVNSIAYFNPLQQLQEETVNFFSPVKLEILSVNDNSVTIRKEKRANLVLGMRLDVFREGETFYHPVTDEPLGQFEKPIGILEISKDSHDVVSGIMLTGQAKVGDKARISKSKIKALFYQDNSVNWHLGDEYFRTLKDSGRFELFDTPVVNADIDTLREEALKHNAQIIIFIDGKRAKVGTLLRQRLFWVDDGKEIFAKGIEVSNNYITDLEEKSHFAVTVDNEPILTFKLSSGFSLITIADLDGDGNEEIVLDLDGRLKVYSPGADLGFLYELNELRKFEHIYISSRDLTENGKDELVISVIDRSKNVQSYVYEFSYNDFRLIWKKEGFLRIYRNRLIYQGFSRIEGYSGPIYEVEYDRDFSISKQLDLPDNTNIYSFVQLNIHSLGVFTLMYDKHGYLYVYDKDKRPVWRTDKDLGGHTKEYKRESHTIMLDAGNWHVSDKIYNWYNNLVVVERVPVTNIVSTLGYNESHIFGLRWNGITMEKTAIIDNIKGSILDYAIYKDKAYILFKPLLGVDLKYIVKGENPIVTYLSVYAINL